MIKGSNGEMYDVLSADGLVGFREEGHAYEYIPNPAAYKFVSSTTFKKKFMPTDDFDEVAKNCLGTEKYAEFDTWQEIRDSWLQKGADAAAKGTWCHLVGEMYWQGKDIREGKFPEEDMVIEYIDYMRSIGYSHHIVEMLVYNIKGPTPLVGLIDMVLKRTCPETGKEIYSIWDYKFVGKAISRNSYPKYKRGRRTYPKMLGPFKELDASSFYGYSFQQSMYKYLCPLEIEECMLVEFTPRGWKMLECHKIEFTKEGDKPARVTVPKMLKSKVYRARKDKKKKKPNTRKDLKKLLG